MIRGGDGDFKFAEDYQQVLVWVDDVVNVLVEQPALSAAGQSIPKQTAKLLNPLAPIWIK